MTYYTIEERIARYQKDLEREPTAKESRLLRATKKLFVVQGGKCAICKIKFEGHDKPVMNFEGPMKNEIYRGLLCENCDIMVVKSGDSIKRLSDAIKFIQQGSVGILNEEFKTDAPNFSSDWSNVKWESK